MDAKRLALLTAFVAALGCVGLAGAYTTNTANVVLCTMYSVYQQTTTWIFVIAILLMVLGACVYAGSNLLPTQVRSNIQSYGMGMVLGGAVGVLIGVISPALLGIISSGSSTSNIATVANMCNAYSGPGQSVQGGAALSSGSTTPRSTAVSPTTTVSASTSVSSTSTTATTTQSTSSISTSSVTTTIGYETLYCSPASAQVANSVVVCTSGIISSTDMTLLGVMGCC